MTDVNYLHLNEVPIAHYLEFLNKPKVRAHLIEHPEFDQASVKLWLDEKEKVNQIDGCQVRAVMVSGELAGWCGIQYELGTYELALVLDDHYWGIGRKVFADMMNWAAQMGHDQVCVHFLDTRPEYKFMKKLAQQVHHSELMGESFTTYVLPVPKPV